MFDYVWKKTKSFKAWHSILHEMTKRKIKTTPKQQKAVYNLSEKAIKNSFIKLYHYALAIEGLTNKKRYCSGYSSMYNIIKKIAKIDDKLLEIGFGKYPFLIKLLNKEGYNCIGIEPEFRTPDNITIFKACFPSLPKKLNKKFNLIFAVLVFPKRYEGNKFHEKLAKSRKEREKIITALHNRLEKKGHLLLLGCMFSKKELEKAGFEIKLYNIPIEIKDYIDNNPKWLAFWEVTLAQKQ
jgi:formiminotetrahydrofolate cyclodeaminase